MQRRSAGAALSWTQWQNYWGATKRFSHHDYSQPDTLRSQFAQRANRRQYRRKEHIHPIHPHPHPNAHPHHPHHHYAHGHSFPFERKDRRYILLYLACGGLTVCLLEIPRRFWAFKHSSEFASSREDCMKHSWRSRSMAEVVDNPYDVEEEARRMREMTDTTPYHVCSNFTCLGVSLSDHSFSTIHFGLSIQIITYHPRPSTAHGRGKESQIAKPIVRSLLYPSSFTG